MANSSTAVNSTESRFLANMLLFIVIVNNFIYQTSLQIPQVIFVLSIFSVLLLFVLFTARLNLFCIVSLLLLSVYAGYTFLVASSDKYEFSRTFFSLISYSSLILSTAITPGAKFLDNLLRIFAIIFTLLIIPYRLNLVEINSNWVCLTMFYLIAFSSHSRPTKRKLTLALSLISLICFYSRGVFICSFISFLFLSFGRDKLTFKLASLSFIIALPIITSSFFFFNPNLLLAIRAGSSSNSETVDSSYIARGGSGRELSDYLAISNLKRTNLLGDGLGTSISYNIKDQFNSSYDADLFQNSEIISVYNGIYGTLLKLTPLGLAILLFAFIKISLRKPFVELSFVLGAFLSIIYYAGFTSNLIGINYLLFILSFNPHIHADCKTFRRSAVLPH